MAYTASQPVKEVPGFARVGEAVRKGILKVLTPLFGTPEEPTTFGKVMDVVDGASAYGLMAGPAAAVGRVRFAAHPVRGPRIVDARFLGSETLPLANRLAASETVAAPKSMFSNSPGVIAMVTRDGNVVLPREADVRLYRSERIRLPNGRPMLLSDLPAIASNIDASSASPAQKQAAVAELNKAIVPSWMYRMYEKDVADANATLARFRAGGKWYDNANVRDYDVLARGDAATVVGSPIGTRYRMGQVVFSPNHVSAMSRDRFTADPRLLDVYNDGYLPYQSITFMAAPKLVKGKPVTPVMRVTDHHEAVRGPTGSLVYGGSDLKLPHAEYRAYDRTYHVGRDIPYLDAKANEPGGVDLMYMLDNGTPVIRDRGSYSASVAVQQASKGGDSPHRNFRNFLATDEVPDSIFGYPVVQREEDYTPEDTEFFKKNPKAAGFYDLGDEEMDEDVPQQAAKAGQTYDTRLTADQERRYQAWRAMLPKPLQYEGDYDLRGYWADPDTVKEGIVDGQHFTDRYKKPNHPTFSVESKYATGENRNRAGRWDGDRFIPPRGKYPGVSNNPGNVEKHERRTDKTLFDGEVGGGARPKRFANFDDPVSGLNAAAAVLARRANGLAKEGKPFTIENYVPSYAPASENDTEGYIKNISKYSGFARNAELDRWDVDGMAKLLKTVVRFESGKPHSDWFTNEEYKAAAELLQEGAFD